MPIALVTGANRGIGLELCRKLRDKGWDVIGTSRRDAPELEEIGVRVERLEVTDQSSIDALIGSLRAAGIDHLDLLVNNAGILVRDRLEDLRPEEISEQFEVNAVGPLRLVAALLPFLKEGSKVAMITSRMGSIADNGSGGYYGYRMSKAALNAASVSLALDLRDRGIAVVILHPGFVKTGMTGGQGDVTPDVSASRLLDRIDELTMESSGTFRHANGEELPW
ncbi:MAG: SDR family oxidoreductase [Myxococcota bacterium]